MRTLLSVAMLAIAILTPTVSAQTNPFLGAWNMTGTGEDTAFVY